MHAKLFSGRCPLIPNNPLAFWNITRSLHQTYYDVLKVKRDCDSKEIREAFINLSKQYHPDTTKCSNSHTKFVKIVEAYNVLSKPDLRKSYDLGLIIPQQTETNIYYNHVSQRNPVDDPIFWNNRNKSQDHYYESQPYYGIKGLKKVSNATIVLVCVLVAVIGGALQFIAINASVTLKRDHMLRASAEAEKILAELQEEAVKNGSKVQLEKLIQRVKEQEMRKRQDM